MNKYIFFSLLFLIHSNYGMQEEIADQAVGAPISFSLEGIKSLYIKKGSAFETGQQLPEWYQQGQLGTVRLDFEPNYSFSTEAYSNYKIFINNIYMHLTLLNLPEPNHNPNDDIDDIIDIGGSLKLKVTYNQKTVYYLTDDSSFSILGIEEVKNPSVLGDINFAYFYKNLHEKWWPVLNTLQNGESLEYSNGQLIKRIFQPAIQAHLRPLAVITLAEQQAIQTAYAETLKEIKKDFIFNYIIQKASSLKYRIQTIINNFKEKLRYFNYQIRTNVVPISIGAIGLSTAAAFWLYMKYKH